MDTTHQRPAAATRRSGALRALRRTSERGASLVEYALLVALIAVVMIGAVTLLGDTASDSLNGSSSSILDATG
jgi:Flp pilus assembly pilin Flp